MTNHPNRSKDRTGPLLAFQVRDAHTGARLRDASGAAITVHAYTPKAAKHQGKKANGGEPVLVTQRGGAS